MKSQKQMFYESHDHYMRTIHAFYEMQRSNNPMTQVELQELIKRRPDVYSILGPLLSNPDNFPSAKDHT